MVFQTTEQVFVDLEHFIVTIVVNWDICPECVGRADGTHNPVSTDPSPEEVWGELGKKQAGETTHLDTNCIYGKISNLSVKMLIDTGAAKSCMDVSTFKRLRLHFDTQDTEDLECLYSANGEPIPVKGIVTVDVNINGLKMPTTFQVLKGLTYPIILGIDFLKYNHAVIDTQNNVVSFHGLVGASFVRKRPDTLAYVRATRSFTIPPLTEAVIQASIDNHYKLQPSIVEPLERLSDKKVGMAEAVVSPSSYFVQCRMLNPTSSSVFFKQGFCLGTIEPIDIPEHSLNVIDSHTPSPQTAKVTPSNLFQSPEHVLSELEIKIDKEKFSKSDYATFTQFIAKNRDIFATSLKDLPGTEKFMHKIETTTEKPIRLRTYRTTPAARAEIKRQTDEMLQMGNIQESECPWNAPGEPLECPCFIG